MNLNDLKVAINNSDEESAANLILNLYIENPDNFKKGLLLSNSLPEPLNRDFKEKKLTTLIQSFLKGGTQLIDKNIDIVGYTKEFAQITQAISIINTNSQSNLKRLEKNKFYSDYTISEQLQMFCIYLEDQNRLSNTKSSQNINYMTGMEKQVAKHSVDNYENVKVSIADNFEALIEIADTLFRLLYFKSGKNLEKAENFIHEGISPYNIGSFEEILHLTFQRNMLNLSWGKFKYREWELKIDEIEEKKFHLFLPAFKQEYKKEKIGVNRYIYRDHINSQREHANNLLENKTSIKFLEKLIKKNDLENIESLFRLHKKEYFKSNKFIKSLIRAQRESLDEIYKSLEYDGIEIEDIFKGFEYLFTIATIYQRSVLSKFDEDDTMQYGNLAPIVDKSSLINQFKELYELDEHIAEKVINNFIFVDKSKLDVFSQPLIYVGKDKVVFCPSLILQMNSLRIIEMLATILKKKLSAKGTEFEKQLRFILSFNPHIKVNTNKIEFKAYDGRDIEYDFIGMFEDHLLLIEFKHLQVPFSDKDYKTSLDTIKIGVNQVNRRADVLQKDWNKLKEKCSFELPDYPFEESKIIKLVCTNIFNFSTFVRDGIEIIDSSSLLKFFMAPEIKGVSVGNEVEEVFQQNLWKESYPSVQEFREFLKCPIAVQPYIDCYEGGYKPIERVEEDDHHIYFFDYSLVKDPYENFAKELSETEHKQFKNIKIGRNDICPCQSGKKYKKCCGA